MTASPTIYRGILFRSRLEATWAIFLDLVGVDYCYEHKQLAVGEGFYLPDFWLPDLGVWLELKPDTERGPSQDERSKAEAVANYTGQPCLIFCGFPTGGDGLNEVLMFLPGSLLTRDYFQTIYRSMPQEIKDLYTIAALTAKSRIGNMAAKHMSDCVMILLAEIGVINRYVHNSAIQKYPREAYDSNFKILSPLLRFFHNCADETHKFIKDTKRRLA